MRRRVVVRACGGAVFASILFAGILVLESPEFWHVAQGWAQSLAPTPTRKIVLPKVVRDYLAQHPNDKQPEAPTQQGNYSPDDPNELIAATKQKKNERGGVIEHSFGQGQTDFEQTYVEREYLTIIAKAEAITLEEVVGHRGNCALISVGSDFPLRMKYGDSAEFVIACSTLIEIEARTDKGTVTLTWDQ